MNFRRGFLSISFTIVSVASYCQTPGLSWLGVLDGDNTKSPSQITVDNAGNVYTVGLFMGTLDVDPTNDENLVISEGSADGFIIKQKPTGDLEWMYRVGGDQYQSVTTIDIGADGNIVVTGYYEGTVDFDRGTGTTEYTSSFLSPYIMKLSPDGVFIWAKGFDSDGSAGITSVSIDKSNNNIFIAGLFQGVLDSDPSAADFPIAAVDLADLWFAKFEPDGDFITAVTAGGSGDDKVISMELDGNNHVVAMGTFSGTVDLNPGTGTNTYTSNGSDDMFVLKLDNAFAYQWAGQVASPSQIDPRALAIDASNNIYFNGTIYGNTDFDPAAGNTNTGGTGGNFFVAKWKPDGSYEWAKGVGGLTQETGEALAVDGNGNVFVAGTFTQNFDINPDAPFEVIAFKPAGFDLYLAKFSSSGSLLWYQPIPSGDIISAASLATDSNNNIYMTGEWNGTVDFTTNICIDGNRETQDNTLVYIVKFDGNTDTSCFGFFAQPEPIIVGCVGRETTIAAPAGGTTHITYQWQIFNGTVWKNLIDQEPDDDNSHNGYFGTNTPYLVITSVQGAEQGDLRLMVTGDGVTTLYSDVVNFTIHDAPTIPGVTATSGCGPGYYKMQAFSTSFHGFKWYVDDIEVEDAQGEELTLHFDNNAIVGVSAVDEGCEGDKALVAINTDACAQPPGLLWVHQIGPGLIQPIAMAVDGNDDLVMVGVFYEAADFDPGPADFIMTPVGTSDYFIAKYKADGTFLWAKQTSMHIFDVSVGTVDDVYYTGNFSGTVDFDPGSGIANMSVSGTGTDIAIVELDGDGTFQWAKQLRSTSNDDENQARAITEGSSGEIIITGNFRGTMDFDPGAASVTLTSASAAGPDIFVAKYDETGALLWARRMGSTAFVERGYDVVADVDGNIYTAGLFQTTVDFDPAAGGANTFNLTSSGATDAFIQCLYPDGTFRWAVKIGGTGADEAVTIDLDDSDHPVIGGHFSGNLDFDPGAGTFMMSGGPTFLLKLTDLGAFQWARATGGVVEKIFVDDTDNVVFTGSFSGTVDFDPGVDAYRLETAVSLDIFVAQLNGAGSFLWAYNTNASGLEYFSNESFGVAMDSEGDIYVVGYFNNVIDVDPTNCTLPVQAQSSSRETFIQKIRFNHATICLPLEPTNIAGCDANDIIIPSAATGTTNITYQWYYFDQMDGSFQPVNALDTRFEGTQTAELTIHATPTFGEGIYRVEASGDFASTEVSYESEVTVSITPDAPTFNPVSFCSPGQKNIEVVGDNDGNYRWYADPAAEPIAGAVDHDFTTDFLDASQSYYVTEVRDECESDFTEAYVEIDIGLDAPKVTDATSCSSPASLTLKATHEVGGLFRWYEAPDDTDPVAENSGTFVTPSLTTTTSYFVALQDGTCESLRTEVVAHVGSLSAPTVGSTSICTGATATFTVTGAGSNEVRWYTAASGGSPIHTGASFTTPALSATTTYHVSFFASACESARTAVTVTVNTCTSNQPPVIATTSSSTAAGSTLTIPLSPLLSDPDNNLNLSTLKIAIQPKSGAIATIDQNGQLVIDYSGVTFTGDDELTIEVCDLANSCVQQKITIRVEGSVVVYNAVSPNGDGKNDVLFLEFIDGAASRENQVKIYNRWGDIVFDVENYNNTTNVFNGRSNGGKELPSGTYYYKIVYTSGKDTQTGYLSLTR